MLIDLPDHLVASIAKYNALDKGNPRVSSGAGAHLAALNLSAHIGEQVCELTKRKIEHVALVHPAARGKIRKRERYIKHVEETLSARRRRGDIRAAAHQLAADARGDIEG